MIAIQDSKLAKFGGSSIATAEDVDNLQRIIADDDSRRFIVLSAPGRRHPGDVKVTDMLIGYSRNQVNVGDIVDRFEDMYPDCGDTVERLLTEVHDLDLPEDAYRDAHAALGEQFNAMLFAERHGYSFANPINFLTLGGSFGDARILPESREAIRELFDDRDGVSVIPGFYGYMKSVNDEGRRVATLSRGGSDTTGSYVAASLGVAEYENFTDSPVLAAHPDMIENPAPVVVMTYEEMRDLSVGGFNILHPEAIIPVQEARVPLHIRSTGDYPNPGTRVLSHRIYDPENPIAGVAYTGGAISMSVSKPGLDNTVGLIADIAGLFRDQGIGLTGVTQGVDDVSFNFRANGLNGEIDQLHLLSKAAYDVLGGNGTDVSLRQNLGDLVVAGIGIRNDPHVATKIETELQNSGVEIVHQSMGALKRSVVFGVPDYQAQLAVQAVYDSFIK
tara:strand:+ start:2385 stop:3722 length:1338 start_codon:yes stop_codon:yes gene_type:complete